MTDNVGEIKQKAQELCKPLEELMSEARKEGLSLEVYMSAGMDGKPCTRIAVVLR